MNKKLGRRPKTLPAEVHALRKRIDQWRSTRKNRSHMPEDLWSASVAAAREHGASAVSRTLGVKYEGLRKRLKLDLEVADATAQTFVEVNTAQQLDQGKRESITLELTSAGGARFTMRLEGDGNLNVPALVAAFWESNR